jgi:hypothetical protein
LSQIELFEVTPAAPRKMREPENWYTEPFTKRHACQTPGQCGDDCDCGCPYNTMTDVERLPLIETIAQAFPNEWLAFIISPAEDEEYEPLHGKLVAHSPNPDEIYDAVNTVLWNQHVYVYFNGNFETLQSSYGDGWLAEAVAKPPQPAATLPAGHPLPTDLLELIYSAVDQLYSAPKINEAIRRLRLARMKAANPANPTLMAQLDAVLDKLESPLPLLDEVIWQLEEICVDFEPALT